MSRGGSEGGSIYIRCRERGVVKKYLVSSNIFLENDKSNLKTFMNVKKYHQISYL